LALQNAIASAENWTDLVEFSATASGPFACRGGNLLAPFRECVELTRVQGDPNITFFIRPEHVCGWSLDGYLRLVQAWAAAEQAKIFSRLSKSITVPGPTRSKLWTTPSDATPAYGQRPVQPLFAHGESLFQTQQMLRPFLNHHACRSSGGINRSGQTPDSGFSFLNPFHSHQNVPERRGALSAGNFVPKPDIIRYC
jgi:hypothetical protein